jgi:cell division protein ZapD
MPAPDPSSQHAPTASAPERAVLEYEQPLNERMRTFLRLEFLYRQLEFHAQQPSAWCTRAAVAALLEILAITARGDVRSDVLKELERHMAVIHEYKSRPGADDQRVHTVVANLARLRNELNAAGGQFMQRLRESDFLSAIKHRSAIPGGTCEFDLPDYGYWINQPFATRSVALAEWTAIVRPLCDAVVELLWLTRQNTHPRRETASSGVYQLMLDKHIQCQLLRIALPAGSDLFPEVSGSHHRCTIRFLRWSAVDARPAQTNDDVPFLLTTGT